MDKPRSARRLVIPMGMLVAILVCFGASVEPAAADGGPHGTYRDAFGSQTDKCAACHRVHQGKSGRLLKAESAYGLCLTCHNGTGSRLDVLDGVKLSTAQSDAISATQSSATPRDASTKMSISVAPYADGWSVPGGTMVYTVRVLNISSADITASATCSGGSCTVIGSPTSSIYSGGVAYITVNVVADATAGATVTTTINVTSSPAGADPTATVVVKTVSQNGIPGATLNGGGFRFVNGAAVTSRHNVNPADISMRPWGYAGMGKNTYLSSGDTTPSNTGGNINVISEALQCTRCHNPHGNDNYRMLNTRINSGAVGSGAEVLVRVRAFYPDDATGTFVTNEGARGLEAGAPANKYVKEYYGSTEGHDANDTSAEAASDSYGLATFCGACHTAYPSAGAGLSLTGPVTDGGPSETHFRHRTEEVYTWWTNPTTGLKTFNPETSNNVGDLAYTGDLSGYTVATGDRAIGAASGAKGVVTVKSALALTLSGVRGAFKNGETVTIKDATETTTKATATAAASSAYTLSTTQFSPDANNTGTLVLASTAAFIVGDAVTGATSGTSGVVVLNDTGTNTLTLDRVAWGTGATLFQTGEAVTGASAGSSTAAGALSWPAGAYSPTGQVFTKLRLASTTGEWSGMVDANNTDPTGRNKVVTCLTCHRVHGTATSMSGYALKVSLGGQADEDLSPAQGVVEPNTGSPGFKSNSVLLYTNNRGMCESCHQW